MGPTHSDLQPVAEVAASWSGKACAKLFLKCFVTKLNTLGRKAPKPLPTGVGAAILSAVFGFSSVSLPEKPGGSFPSPG